MENYETRNVQMICFLDSFHIPKSFAKSYAAY